MLQFYKSDIEIKTHEKQKTHKIQKDKKPFLQNDR